MSKPKRNTGRRASPAAKAAASRKTASKTSAKAPKPTKPAARKASRGARKAATASAAAGGAVRIRHYCQGIGDCHLLRFPIPNLPDFTILIDCGVHLSVSGGNETVKRIVQDIRKETKRIDVVVVTHEHWDHVSGFLTAADEFAQLEIGAVWLPWTENRDDPQARQLDKYREQSLAALQLASSRLALAGATNSYLSAIGESLETVLGFHFGAKGEKVRTARDKAIELGAGKQLYLEPGDDPLKVDGLKDFKVYVLGPPRDAKLIGVTQRISEMYTMGTASPMALALGATQTDGPADQLWTPFDLELGFDSQMILPLATAPPTPEELQAVTSVMTRPVAQALERLPDPPTETQIGQSMTIGLLRKCYAGPLDPTKDEEESTSHPAEAQVTRDQSWRRIDGDWLGLAADLAMQLDNRTNNTSLVLAFEHTATKRVFLFPGDAQIGSWMSWPDLKWGKGSGAVTGKDLMERTVYLKVAHHGSHNATRKPDGLELMRDRDLAAFIPVNEADAKKVKWGEMPFHSIISELATRTNGRVIRADDPWLKGGSRPHSLASPSGCIKALRHAPDGLWVEVDVG